MKGTEKVLVKEMWSSFHGNEHLKGIPGWGELAALTLTADLMLCGLGGTVSG